MVDTHPLTSRHRMSCYVFKLIADADRKEDLEASAGPPSVWGKGWELGIR